MSDFYIPPLPDDFTDKVMKRIQEEEQRIMIGSLRNKIAHPNAKKQRR